MEAANRELRIDEEKCRGCGRCVEASGGKVIRLENYKARASGNGRLENPHLLVAGCPEQAISLIDFPLTATPGGFSVAAEMFSAYFGKMQGSSTSPARVHSTEILWSWIGAFLGIASVSYINFNLLSQSDMVMVIGSFGASAVLIYGAINSPLAQPRNLVGGHVISAVIGVTCYQLFSSQLWLASAMAVATASAAMHATKTLHPPGGATALIAVIGSSKIHALGYLYTLVPVGTGAVVMLVIALLFNNIPSHRKYPDFWR